MPETTGDDAIRRVLEAASRDSETLRLLQTDPDALAERYQLSPDVLESLKSADVLLEHLGSLRRQEKITFETGMTITAGARRKEEITFETGTTITAGLRAVLEQIAAESRTLQRLRTDPDALIDDLGIDRSQLERLKDVSRGRGPGGRGGREDGPRRRP